MTRILFIHDGTVERERIQDLFEGKDGAALVAAGDLDSALEHLRSTELPYDAVLVRWSMPGHQALKLLATPWPGRHTKLLAFNKDWQPGDLRRAFHLGVDGFFSEPLEPSSVLAEMNIIERQGRGLTRARLLRAESIDLLSPQDDLWDNVSDPVWGRRMAAKARQVLEQILEEHEARISRVRSDLERAVPDGAPLDGMLALAVCAALRLNDTDLLNTAEEHGVELATLDALVESLEADIADEIEQEVHRPEMIWAVEALATELTHREMSSSALDALARLRERGESLSEGLAPSPEKIKEFLEALSAVLHVPFSEIEEITPEITQALARQVISSDVDRGLARARLTLLRHCLRDVVEGAPYTPEDSRIRALAGIFGTQPHRLDDEMDNLKAVLSSVDPGVPEPLPNLALLLPLARDLEKKSGLKGVSAGRLKAAMQALALADKAGGELDRARLRSFESLLSTIFEARVGQRTLMAVTEAFEQEKHTGITEHISEMLRPDGAQSLMQDLEQWSEVPFDDRPQLIAMGTPKRAAPSPAPAAQEEAPTERPAPPQEVAPAPQPAQPTARASGRKEPPPSRKESAPSRRESPPSRPRAQPGRARRPRAEAAPELAAFLEAHAKDLGGILTSLKTLEAEGDEATRQQLRRMLGLKPGPASSQDVRRLMGEAKLEGAYVAAQELPDDPAKTVPVLNEVALSLRVCGHLSEGAELFERATKLQPNRPSLLFNYARIKIELGHFEEAAELLRRVVGLAPDLKAARVMLGELERRIAATPAR